VYFLNYQRCFETSQEKEGSQFSFVGTDENILSNEVIFFNRYNSIKSTFISNLSKEEIL